MSDQINYKSGINPHYIKKVRNGKDISYYLNGLNQKNRFILSECITLLESTNESKRSMAEAILEKLPVMPSPSVRVGITGSPGVGKSTFIDTFGMYLIQKGHQPAVLAIDPSSKMNRGSILGDKTRMTKLSVHPSAFVRPSPAGMVLGGIAAYTKEAIQLCEAAGFDTIIVETVGVGQSETEVDFVTDVNVLLLQPGAGDDLQGIKRGIIENADIFIINKADGLQLKLAKQTKVAYSNAISLFHHKTKNWLSPVLLTSALEETGFDKVYETVNDYIFLLKQNNIFNQRRTLQEKMWFEKQCMDYVHKKLFQEETISSEFERLKDQIQNHQISTKLAIRQMEKLINSILIIKK